MHPPALAVSPGHVLPVLVWLLALTAGCGNDCVDMCQQYARWVDECGSDWETAFPEEGWTSVQDCYDDHWNAPDSKKRRCADEATDWSTKACW